MVSHNSVDNTDKNFRGQHADETLIYFFRHHWVVLLREILYLLIFLALIFLAFSQTEFLQNSIRDDSSLRIFYFIGFLLSTIFFHRFFIKILNYFLCVGIITDMRIVDAEKSLFLREKSDSIDLAQIQNIETLQDGAFPNLFKFGDIKIFLTASHTVKTFHIIPHVKFHFRTMTQQKEERQRKLGLKTPPSENAS